MQSTTSPATTPEPSAIPQPAESLRARPFRRWLRLLREHGTLGRLLRVGIAGGAVGLGFAVTHMPPAHDDVRSLAAALGDAANGAVHPEDVRWEPSRGAVMDAARGRFVLFVSKADGETTRDVWRGKVRISPEGKVIDVTDVYNLTHTPDGDDTHLVVRGDHAAFTTTSYGQLQSVTLLDLAGEGEKNLAESASEKAMAYVTNRQETGSGAGIGRVAVLFDSAPQAVGLSLGDDALRLELADGGARHRAMLSFATEELDPGASGMHTQAHEHLKKKLSHWAVDTARAVPWIGQEPIAWLEEKALGVRADAKDFSHGMHKRAFLFWSLEALALLAGVGLLFARKGRFLSAPLFGGAALSFGVFQGFAPTSTALASAKTEELAAPTSHETPSVVLDTSEASVEAAHWPPAKMPTIWKDTEPGEGEWAAPHPTWLRRVPQTDPSAPPPFMTSFVRPDEEHPQAHVALVAMDMRQLDVEMEAGMEDPQPLSGPNGPGKLPRDPSIFTRVVACFNGAFKTEHGHYGMMVKKRVLLPPQPGAATVITTNDRRVGIGTWGANKTVSGLKGLADADIESFRQNLDPLVDHGEVNPYGRSQWGFSAPGKGVQTERSGLCVTSSGHLVYAWGDDVTATTLAKGMKMAGCDYGMHLDMNPYHTGFLWTNITDLKSKSYKSELLNPGMEISTARYIEYAPKDFFYVMVHDPTPAPIDGGSAWTADPGAQPAPSWMPGLWRAEAQKVENPRRRGRARALADPRGREGSPRSVTAP